jgi:hypothetical protein
MQPIRQMRKDSILRQELRVSDVAQDDVREYALHLVVCRNSGFDFVRGIFAL